MARYIDTERYSFPTLHQKELNDYMKGWNACLKSVLQQPTADAEEVKHGKWEKVQVVSEEYGYVQVYYQHKDCKISPTGLYESPFEYCPRCGAKMDGGNAG